MILLTRYDIPLPAAGTHPTSVSQPLRRGIGLRLYDLALLVPPGRSGKERSGKGRSRERRIRGVTTILEDAGFRTVVLAAPGDTEGPPEPVMTESVADARALVILLEEGSSPGGIWLSWMVGFAAALKVPAALLPVARRDATRGLWSVPPPLQTLPYMGVATAVGERDATFWVMPAGHPPVSREAINLDYWLHMYRMD
jgi:hypothetical protein